MTFNQIVLNENSLELQYAKLWKRILAYVTDCLIIISAMILIALALSKKNSDINSFLPLVAIFALYFKDGLHRGQSLGKKIFGITVINKSNYQYCSVFQSFLRNILHSLTIIDWCFLLINGKQRLGDKAANTIVVNTNSIRNVK